MFSTDEWFRETLRLNGYPEDPPRALFKFVPSSSPYFSAGLLELFLHNRIRLSCRREFNDPFDSTFALHPVSSDDIRVYLTQTPERLGLPAKTEEEIVHAMSAPTEYLERANRSMGGSLDEWGIYSMSSSAKHPLMWGHYATAHKGLALIFRHAARDTDFGAFPVRYQAEFPRVHATVDGMEALVGQALVKGEDWRYEREWRLVAPKAARTWIELHPKVFAGVVFGALCQDQDIAYVMELSQRRVRAGFPPIDVIQARIDDEKFELDFFALQGNTLVPIELD
ncbi:MAG: DUF2971 domain-containing protein [Gammaproteobacteria bacterium]